MKSRRTFWSTANEAFSAKERSAYNRFKLEIYLASDRLRDALRLGDDERTRERANELHLLICEIPSMEGRR